MFDDYIDIFNDRLDFIEFKQKYYFKQPNHKAVEFANLSLSEFILIKILFMIMKMYLNNEYINLKILS